MACILYGFPVFNMEWILPESIDFPEFFHGMEIYNYCGESKSILLVIKVNTISILRIFIFFSNQKVSLNVTAWFSV